MSAHAAEHRPNYKAAVYGSVVVAALLGALRAEHADAQDKVVALVGTTVVFWIAHVWAGVVSERLVLGHGYIRHHIRDQAREEWPLVEAGFVPLVPLLLAWAGLISDVAGSRLATALALAQLVGWGLAVGRRSRESWPLALLSGAVTGALGLVVVLLEVALH
jgi:hypothetical protein